MARDDWFRVIDDASMMGVEMVQLIGGEPTLHPDFTALVERVLDKGVAVEVYSNLVKVTPAM
jgi:MoaA/NifB/PqqE/SkfB family radical SAM enzyme